jgi:hypothetical protein
MIITDDFTRRKWEKHTDLGVGKKTGGYSKVQKLKKVLFIYLFSHLADMMKRLRVPLGG